MKVITSKTGLTGYGSEVLERRSFCSKVKKT